MFMTTLALNYNREESEAVIALLNIALEVIETWGNNGNPYLQEKKNSSDSPHVLPRHSNI